MELREKNQSLIFIAILKNDVVRTLSYRDNITINNK